MADLGLTGAVTHCSFETTVYGDAASDNRLYYCDNVIALQALTVEMPGAIPCIYIDPPYNTGQRWGHYLDRKSTHEWLAFMEVRIRLLHQLLSPDGLLFISIDEARMAELKLLCDGIFGKENACPSIIWEKKRKPSYRNHPLVSLVEFILVYAKDRTQARPLTLSGVSDTETYPLYNAVNPVRTLLFPPHSFYFPSWSDGDYPPQAYDAPTSQVVLETPLSVLEHWNTQPVRLTGRWRYNQSAIDEQVASGDYYIVKSAKFRPRRVRNTSEAGKKMHNLWTRAYGDFGSYEDAAQESLALFGTEAFDYPKPETLMAQIIEASTQPGEYVLDAFAGSGTTGAVAQKLDRRWLMCEEGPHCLTHIVPRMQPLLSTGDGFRLLIPKDRSGQASARASAPDPQQ